ncbi:sugar transferase [Oceanirhabdus seepicola]|uniref:Sugar transferase n=1 Tax=Oceanirhabdus seepicola TaxID=2828781 RepID=A0A9J6P271_9CLOT|nr:sugar transferase [Oceanirhabdus seepicola]MCM1990500.1 sugar transferase [Oceanirhabdus seepicola]
MLEVKYQDSYMLESELIKSNYYHFLKRVIDIIGALAGIIIMFIPCLIVSLLIKKDGGPIFFIQRRVGQNGKEFNMYKFRSMCMNAEELLDKLKEKNEMDGPMFKIKDDPRITKVGKFIRKTSIDELPQLLNILKGDMSIVGPRPSLPKEVAEFTDFQKLRLVAKPGLTCYWQVRGRNDIGFEEWMEMDVQYCMDRTILLDIILIFKTVNVLFGDSSAS